MLELKSCSGLMEIIFEIREKYAEEEEDEERAKEEEREREEKRGAKNAKYVAKIFS